ncbi:MAG TPA: hypothetical protein ENJ51_08955 [Leucothrix mucor]|uniref:Uncharacterized protein n=1 Tax=Leucothrix mucor TaxID=45248 RepID=A0A7V2T0J2_LEUMU|nr:hypothetical protein [Leucothrix mucor]
MENAEHCSITIVKHNVSCSCRCCKHYGRFSQWLFHPITALDHIVEMVAVGL